MLDAQTFRSAAIEGGEVTFWVKTCLAGQRRARQVHLRKQTSIRERERLN
jgi:hypothetical protein